MAMEIPREVVFGIRPEDIFLPGSAPSYAIPAEVEMEVTAVETLGAETVLILKPDDLEQRVTARVGRDVRTHRGEKIKLIFDLSSALLFDPETTHIIEDR